MWRQDFSNNGSHNISISREHSSFVLIEWQNVRSSFLVKLRERVFLPGRKKNLKITAVAAVLSYFGVCIIYCITKVFFKAVNQAKNNKLN